MSSFKVEVEGSPMEIESSTGGLWLRRVASYVLGVLIPWSLLSQLIGTIATGRSWPEGVAGEITRAVAFVLVVVLSAALGQPGQSPTHRLLGLQVCTASGAPASQFRMAVRSAAHIIDFASLGLGFLWPLWSAGRQTFADKIVRTTVGRAPYVS